MRNFLLLFACLLLIVTPLYAQDDDSDASLENTRDRAWLGVSIRMYLSVAFLPSPPALKWISTPVFPEITSQPALLKFNLSLSSTQPFGFQLKQRSWPLRFA